VISEVEEDKSGVLLVGHNPVMEELLRALTGRGEPMATGTLARIDFDFDEWSRVTEDIGGLKCIVRPNELAAG
jgi:phosphohistidine phosphatase SixA